MTDRGTEADGDNPSGYPMLVEVVVGVVGRPHGVRGEVAVESRTDEPDRRFAPGEQLRSEGSARTLTVAAMRWHSGRMLVRFAGLDDRTAAEAVRGVRLVTDVDPDERPEEPGEFYDRQLVGLAAQTPDGVRVGEVVDVLHLPAQDVLEIRTAAGLRLVPFVTDLVPQIDLEHGMLTVADREGLLTESED